MSRRWLLSLLCLAVLFLSFTEFTRARGELRVDETNSSILLEKNPAEVLLAVENPSTANVTAKIQLELLDPANSAVAKTTDIQSIARGGQRLRLSLPFAFPNSGDVARKQLLWYRLHYRLSPQDSPNETLADGIISLSEMTPDLFELRVSAAEMVRGGRYRVRIQAVHPLTQRPSANVRIDGQVRIEGDADDDVELSGSASTDDKGRAVLDFELPARFPKYPHRVWSTGELRLTGKKGEIVAQTSGEVRVEQFARALITTDKPLYQPGQVMHIRALMLTASIQALANYETFFKICDPEGAVLYRTVVTTSRFGIASTDWTIPENTRLGDYRIWVGIDGGDDETSQQIRISRYELPNFKVNVDLDRKFYLPGQNATATVRADYLFGQPLLRGKVRVVRESERRWNYQDQKWEADEENEQKGETDANGSFAVQLDLKSAHQDLADDYDDRRFKDLTYAAYITDPTTNRTEQRRFDVRVTRDSIHVYVLETYNWTYSSQLPVKFYVSTFYADGSPARCKVNVAFTDDADDDDHTRKHVATVATNRYGLAKISTRLPKQFDDTSAVDVVVSASDSSGRKGSGEEELRFDDDPRVQVETDKTVYRPGEPINAVISGNDQVSTVIVDLAGEGGLIRSERLKLRNGRASITFPFKPQFKSGLNVVAYPEGTTSRSTVVMRTVLYPYNSELNVDVRSSRETYRPGENAELRFNVTSAADRSQESALGVVVMDQAVLERFRTDQEFGGGSSGFGDSVQQFLGVADNFAGVTMRDLQQLDTSRPVSPDLDMVAAVVVRNMVNYFPAFYSDDDFEDDAADVFADELKKQLKPLKQALESKYLRTLEYPHSEAELRESLSQEKINFDKVRDPWGMPYHLHFYVDKQNETLAFWSSGADKRYDTEDDFFVEDMSWPYFRRTGLTIDRAVMRHHQLTGKFIRDAAALRDELSKDGLNLDQMHDRWGKPYRLEFEVDDSHIILQIRSGGPDKQFSKDQYLYDDFIIWKSAIDYFAEPREQISAALTENLKRTRTFPRSDEQLRQALGRVAGTFNNLRDPWGNAYYTTFGSQSVYGDRVQLENRANFGEVPTLRTNITPMIKTFGLVVLHSNGPDALKGTGDDFVIATFTGLMSEQPRGAPAPVVPISLAVLSGNNGGIAGLVTDMVGAAVPGATVHARRLPAMQEYEASTNESGKYTFLSLPPGTYQLTFAATGFNWTTIDQVLVRPHNITEVNAALQVGTISETVTVTAEAVKIDTQVSALVSSRNPRITLVTKSGSEQVSTPRLREYFPETLLWQPSLETDKQGRAQLSFKLADNITTWKMLVIGSTIDGRIGTAEKEIKAFQPFFVEHDPPRVLTEGDQISLPVVVRNYLSQPQKVELEIKPESWFSLLGPPQKQTSVASGDATRETFDFRVIASVKDGKQRITARGSNENDAIEKTVSVHPDGEEVSVTAGDILDDETPLEFEIAQSMLANSRRGELKIYPNLLTHVVEGVEAIMQRPHGCGEQTISSTYPSLLLLRHSKKTGEGFPLSALAQRYLKDGYSRLLNYRAANGGFTYWGYGDPDVALTAYALEFLADASEVTSVDEDVLKHARDWLVQQQRPDSSWRRDYSQNRAATASDVLLSVYVTRVLARTESGVSEPVKRAFEFLGRESQRIDEPYLLASFALAAVEAKDIERAKPVIEKLRKLALAEGNTTYWALETNTPFHGWGLAGRVETTALVVQALAQNCNAQLSGCADRKLINGGLLFLLKQKDPHGVWYSTQATVNVLDAMLWLFAQNRTGTAGGQTAADVVVNGNRVQTLQLNDRFNNPITVDVSQYLTPGKNRISIKRQQGLPLASVQAVAKYYVPWTESKPDSTTTAKRANANSKSDLRLNVQFDKTEAQINDEITCRVEAGRTSFRGYGMLLAEIGVPPGAEIDRSSLQALVEARTIEQYDVLPDRVVVYLWPRADGISFSFTFRPRFGLNAKSAASTIYDYYNPEAAVVVPPSVFKIR